MTEICEEEVYEEVTDDAKHRNIIPILQRSEQGSFMQIENFSSYFARQLGFVDEKECPVLSPLIELYFLRKDGFKESILRYFSKNEDPEYIYKVLQQELDRSILSYFAFHWDDSTDIINQILSVDMKNKKLKELFLKGSRDTRFNLVEKINKTKNLVSTVIHISKSLMPPMRSKRGNPVIVLMGGGMGAGKSTVIQRIKNKHPDLFEPVLVEADAFKENNLIFKHLSRHHEDMLFSSERVHKSSTKAANKLLVDALNLGRDIIFDSTMAWETYVRETIQMIRNVHHNSYSVCTGHEKNDDGTTVEKYWKIGNKHKNKSPYRIDLVGVICDPYLAVSRGIRRAIETKRAVRVQYQLQSHQRFAKNFKQYSDLVDNVKLYCSNVADGDSPKVLGRKDYEENDLFVDELGLQCLRRLSTMNNQANSVDSLFPGPNPFEEPSCVWKDTVLHSSRFAYQLYLKLAIRNIEKFQG